ncbi:MAG: hypothetical protein ACTSUG_11365, partial [Candidatus Helarchaeota archaeon]
LQTDNDRILYSKIRYLKLSDETRLKMFFHEFEQQNKDPFWWKIIINNTLNVFKRKELERELKKNLPLKMSKYLIRYIRIKKYKWLNMKGIKRNLIDNIASLFPNPFYLIYLKIRDFLISSFNRSLMR